MFNFKKLKIEKRDASGTNSFVGIRRNSLNNELEFRLPRGFDDFPENDFNSTKKLFFDMYKTFKKFENDTRSFQEDKKSAGKDNFYKGEDSYKFKDNEDNDVVLYSKISIIENLLEAYKDLSLDVIINRDGRNEDVDYSEIHKYLHKATYLDDDVIYIDEMELSRRYLNYDSSTLIDLFCFILFELENELSQESDENVKKLANRLRDNHLNPYQSLFDEDTFEKTILSLKDILNHIDKTTSYKDESYWNLYDPIESFLYGELDMQSTDDSGTFWGISNFYQIWEDMCNTYAFSNFKVIYSDTDILFKGKRVSNSTSGRHKIFKDLGFQDPFFISFRGRKRFMRPDLVHTGGNENLGKNLLESAIDIHITRRAVSGSVDFVTKYVGSKSDKKKLDLYKFFLRSIKSSLNSGKRSSFKIRGASIRNNTIINYPLSELDKIKNTIIDQVNKKNERIDLLDWKYMDEADFLSGSGKVNTDISKQICYEFCIKNSVDKRHSISSQFVIPCFYSSILDQDIGVYVDEGLLYKRLNENNIYVFKANFMKIQEAYLNNDF